MSSREAVTDSSERKPRPSRDARALRHNWWYVIALVAVGSVVSPVLDFRFLVVFEPRQLLYLPVLLAALPGLVLFVSVAIPFAFYFDAKYVRAVTDDWQPSSRLWGLTGGVILVVTVAGWMAPVMLVCAAPSFWYLYRRRASVGVP
jgi:hypothetical protein